MTTPVTRCDVLVGRDREVSVLASAVGRLTAAQGTGSVTVLVGEAGIGK